MGGWAGAWGVMGVALSRGSCRNLAPSPIPGGKWVAPLSPTRVQAGRAFAPPGRCQGPHNGAPGVGARPAHSAPNNHGSAAAGPVASRGGRTGGQQMGLGCQISSLGRGGGSPGEGRGGGQAPPYPPAAPPASDPLHPPGKRGGRWEGQGGRGEVGGGTACPPPLPPRAGWRGNRP